jgi:lysophospholipase L1-like esterase
MVLVRRVGVALAGAALLLTAACSGNGPSTPKSSGAFTSYVALGDSSVSGPEISPEDLGSGACQRSQKNWPALLGKKLHVRSLIDVSCGGAISTDIDQARADSSAVQPQIDTLSAGTDLVTITIGGNDEGLFTKIVVTCLTGKYHADKCKSLIDRKLDGIVSRATKRITLILKRVRASAPNARLVAVGYLRILPTEGGCVGSKLAPERIDLAAKGMNALSDGLEGAAKRAKVEYVPMLGVSTGHDACSGDQAWVNGLKPVPNDGAFFHPNAAGMRAVAKTVAAKLQD